LRCRSICNKAARPGENGREERALKVAAEFQQRLHHITQRASELEAENASKTQRVEVLAQEISQLDRNSSEYKEELERVKGKIGALEEQSAAATQHLNEAYSQLDVAVSRLNALQHTMGFLREVCQVLAQEHEPDEFARTMVAWFCQHFGVERCSLMRLDDSQTALQIAAHVGIDPTVAR
jgi:septal ring factor EnvC (AmiA/AmiB activator)